MLVAPALFSGLLANDTEYRPGLEVVGEVDSFEVTSSGEIWFGTSRGKVYRSRNWNESWEEVTTPIGEEQPPFQRNSHISRVRFFNRLYGFIAGYLGDDTNVICRTVDGGASWTVVTLPSSLWAYDAEVTAEGLGWIVGSNGQVLFTQDFGASWSSLKAPYDSDKRSYRVHFVSRSTGLVASLSGGLKWTDDGGHSWKRIKSPSETEAISCEHDRIENARLIDGTIIVTQCGEVFARPTGKHESWRPLRAGERSFVAFQLSPEGLLAVASDLEVFRIGPDLASIHSTGAHLRAFPRDIASGADKAVFMDSALRVSVLDAEGLHTSWMMPDVLSPQGHGGSSPIPIVSDREAIAEYLTNGYHFANEFHRIYALSRTPRINGLTFLAAYESLIRFYVFPTEPSSLAGHVAIAVDRNGTVTKVSEDQGLNSVLGRLDLSINSADDAVSLARDFLLLTNIHYFYWEGERGGVNIISGVDEIPFDDDLEGRLERVILTRHGEITPPACDSSKDGYEYRFFSWRPSEGGLFCHSMTVSSKGLIHHDQTRLYYAYGKYDVGCTFPWDAGPNAEELTALISADDQDTSTLVIDYILMLNRNQDHMLYEIRLQNLREYPALLSKLMSLPADPVSAYHKKIDQAATALK